MASKRVTLPPLKVTRRPAYGKKVVKYFERGVGYDLVKEQVECGPPCVDCGPSSVDSGPSSVDCGPSNDSTRVTGDILADLNEPTCYEVDTKASIEGWKSIRKMVQVAVTEMEALPLLETCLCCPSPATMRCQQCGPRCYFCQPCFLHHHNNINLFHVAEIWKNDHFEPYQRSDLCVNIRPSHQCATKRTIPIQLVDEYGMEHKLQFLSCGCEPLAVTMTRAKLWPSSPTNPRFAFTFALLDWAEALLLEAHVSLQDFCNTLKFRCPFYNLNGKKIYSTLINAFEEYRFMKHKLRHLDYVNDALDSGNICPACPKLEGKCVYAMDAVFGLPRKKSSGTSYQGPLFEQLFFHDQFMVDEFVAENDSNKSSQNSCNNFLAGSALRSANRYKALDETAVFGYCCRHEFPGKFINLKHGEKLAYSVYMLERIVQKILLTKKSQVFVMYDIACTLFRHLQSLGKTDILSSVHLSLPIFHSFGHKASCQILFGPRRCNGLGLSDGETMERLWSYLRRFARMTKEMRPAHRVDILSSALVYYGIQTKEKLGHLLLTRLERAIKTRALAEETLNEIISGTFEEQECKVKQWMIEEEVCITPTRQRSKPPLWQGMYFQALHQYYSLRTQVASGKLESTNSGLLSWLNGTLLDLEKKHCIQQRWLPSDKLYKDCEYSIMLDRKEQLLFEILNAGQRRIFLLQLKRKYADGQKIAKRLCTQVSKETRCIKSLLEEWNACQVINCAEEMSLEDALDPLYVRSQLKSLSFAASTMDEEKLQAIQAYLMLCRSKEEVIMLKEDAKNIVDYYREKGVIVKDTITSLLTSEDLYSRGSVSLLYSKLRKLESLLHQGISVLDTMTSNNYNQLSSDEEEDENYDSDSSYDS